jgi:hypothetical protein
LSSSACPPKTSPRSPAKAFSARRSAAAASYFGFAIAREVGSARAMFRRASLPQSRPNWPAYSSQFKPVVHGVNFPELPAPDFVEGKLR